MKAMTNVRSIEENNTRNPIGKALALLRWFMEDPRKTVGVRECAAEFGVAPSSAHRLLGALERDGFLRKTCDGRFSLGLELVRLSNLVVAKLPIREIAFRHMRRLVDVCNETLYLGLYDRGRQEIFFGTSIESSHRLRYIVDTEHWVPVYVGASGLAVMAFLSDAERDAIVRRTRLQPVTDRTITEPYRLERALDEIRSKGYAFTKGQRIPGAVGLAAPIFDSTGQVIGDISMTVPEQRFEPSSEARLAEPLMGCCADITREIGGNSYAAAVGS